MQAIQTRYLSPTNTRGARIKATAMAGSITIPYPYSEKSEQAAARIAAKALCCKLGWASHFNFTSMIGGSLPNGDHCFTFDNELGRDYQPSPADLAFWNICDHLAPLAASSAAAAEAFKLAADTMTDPIWRESADYSAALETIAAFDPIAPAV